MVANKNRSDPPSKSERGRRPKINQAKINKICDYVKQGNYLKTAAQLVKLSPSTLIRWMNTGRDLLEEDMENSNKMEPSNKVLKNPYVQLLMQIEEAEALAEALHVQNIRQVAGKGNWTASAWYLERKHPDKWANKHKLEERKLKIMEERLELEKMQAATYQPDEEVNDDFIEALGNTAEEVWTDEDLPEEETEEN